MESDHIAQHFDSVKKRIFHFVNVLRAKFVSGMKIIFSLRMTGQSVASTTQLRLPKIIHKENVILFANRREKLPDQANIEGIKINLNEIAGLLNWPEVLDDVKRANGFKELIRLLSLYAQEENVEHAGINDSSNCWLLLASKNWDQLLDNGYHHFKRTVGHNYFNFLVQAGDAQIKAVESLLPESILEKCKNIALSMPRDPAFATQEPFSYYYFVLLLWEYVKTIDTQHYLDRLEEPSEGNPLLVFSQQKSMSQDLANSLIEYYTMCKAVSFEKTHNILEIGGGYGRNAYVILTLNPNARIVLVDIMPALYIAQRYLSSVFKERKVFQARSFSCYEEVKEEIEAASIVFLLPHQLSLLPDKQFDLSMNISSFGEMHLKQIEWYFQQINRLTSQYFYMKQWNVSKNPFDKLILNRDDYPYLENWKQIYLNNCAVQDEFFETIYQVNAYDAC